MAHLSLHCRLPAHSGVHAPSAAACTPAASSTTCSTVSCFCFGLAPLSCRHTCTWSLGSGQVCPLSAAVHRCCLVTTHPWGSALQLRLHTAIRLYVLQLLVFELMVWSRWGMGAFGQSPWTSPLLQTLLYVLLGICVPLGLGVTMEVSCSLTHVQKRRRCSCPAGRCASHERAPPTQLWAQPKRHTDSQSGWQDLAQLAPKAPA